MKQEISFDEFLEIESKLEIRIGKVTAAERVPKSDKLLKLTVIFGIHEEDGDGKPDTVWHVYTSGICAGWTVGAEDHGSQL